MAGLGFSAAPAVAEDCPNAALRAENNSTRLPECRAYEKVTPTYKQGFEVTPRSYSDEGLVAYNSLGSFAGNGLDGVKNEYLATRSAAGWTTTALNPPADTYKGPGNSPGPYAYSADLRSSLWLMYRLDEPTEFEYYLRSPNGIFALVGTGATGTQNAGGVVGESADLSHVILSHGSAGSADSTALYELNPGPPRPVSIENTGAPTPGETCFRKISRDGRVIVFASGCNGGAFEVWARVSGSASVAVSSSECTRTSGDPGGACNAAAAAEFAGMSSDGSRVFFTTTQQLVNGDTDQTNDLYECDIPPGAPAPVGTANPCTTLTQVSGAASGANVENVVNVSEDGSRVYFVAHGVLAANLGTNDAAPVAGDNNLYVWEKDAAHPAGQTTFVAKLESNDINGAQSTADGRYLIFNTANKLVASDTDEVADVYRYDADTGDLLRLSTDTNGSGGNEPGAEARVGGAGRAMTDDGSTVIFQTTESLAPADADGVPDVYEWHEGQVSLISNDEGFLVGISSSGRDIFFETGPLAGNGTVGDIYDARVVGGFPVTTRVPCSGEACQGAPALQPQAPGTSASAAFNGPGSPPAAETPPATQPRPKPQTAAQKLAKALKACKAKHNKKKRKACEKRARNTYRRAK
jgi:hypothetical protein